MLVCSTIVELSKLAEVVARLAPEGTSAKVADTRMMPCVKHAGLAVVVEARRLELLTSSLQSWRSTN